MTTPKVLTEADAAAALAGLPRPVSSEDALMECRAAFVAMIKKEDEGRAAWAKTSLKAKWSGPKDGFASDHVNNRWKDFQSGWNTVVSERDALAGRVAELEAAAQPGLEVLKAEQRKGAIHGHCGTENVWQISQTDPKSGHVKREIFCSHCPAWIATETIDAALTTPESKP